MLHSTPPPYSKSHAAIPCDVLAARPFPVHPLQQYVPLFLNKEDLDIAVQSAYAQRNAAQIKLYKDKADRYQQEYEQVGP